MPNDSRESSGQDRTAGMVQALLAQAQLILIVFDLEAILEAKTGSDVGEEVGTLGMLEPLREAAAAAEHLALSL